MFVRRRRRVRLAGALALAALAFALVVSPAGAAGPPPGPKPGPPPGHKPAGTSGGSQYRPASTSLTVRLKRVGRCKRAATRRAVVLRKKCKTKACSARVTRAERLARARCNKLLAKR
jgi:hypothetical protein